MRPVLLKKLTSYCCSSDNFSEKLVLELSAIFLSPVSSRSTWATFRMASAIISTRSSDSFHFIQKVFVQDSNAISVTDEIGCCEKKLGFQASTLMPIILYNAQAIVIVFQLSWLRRCDSFVWLATIRLMFRYLHSYLAKFPHCSAF